MKSLHTVCTYVPRTYVHMYVLYVCVVCGFDVYLIPCGDFSYLRLFLRMVQGTMGKLVKQLSKHENSGTVDTCTHTVVKRHLSNTDNKPLKQIMHKICILDSDAHRNIALYSMYAYTHTHTHTQ